MRITQIAAAVDIAFFLLFYALGSPILAWVNVISVAIYVMAYRAFKQRKNQVARILIFSEVFFHAALGILLIGWESGFHYFLLMFIPAICVSSSRRVARFSLAGLFLFYASLAFLMYFIDPIQPINPLALQIVHIFNLSVVFVMFSYLSMFYLHTVRRAQKKLQVLATTDPLTELFNRRHITFLAEKEVDRFNRLNTSVGILLVDIDHFKAINDQFGHEFGDKVLISVAAILRKQLRKQDLIARWGGEEFLIVLPETENGKAQLSAERIRAGFLDYDWQLVMGQDVEITISAGVSELQHSETLNGAIARADKALYKGKANGRNRVEFGLPE